MGKPKNTTNNIKTKSLNGYGAVGEKLDENNTLTLKQPVAVNWEFYKKTELVWSKLVVMYIYIYIYVYIYIYILKIWLYISSIRFYWVQRFVCCSCWE